MSAASPEPVYSGALANPRAAFFAGMRECLAAPGLVLCVSYLGFGSLLREMNLNIVYGVVSTLTIWALPAQVAALEMYAVGAPLLTVFIAVALINFRFLPMVVTLLPLIRKPGRGGVGPYLLAHIIAITGWALAILRTPQMPPEQRLPYFLGCSLVLMNAAVVGTAAGYALSGVVSREVSYGLVFANPLFFLIVLLVDLRQRARVLALLLGGAAVPALHVVTPTWGLLIAGIGGGTAAYLIDAALRRRA